MVVINTKWMKTQKEILATPKWLKRETKVIVIASAEPVKRSIEGRYGPREVYMVDTVDYGLIYVSPLQLVKIVDALRRSEYKNTTVEL